jgi:cation transport regulator ChaC
MPYYFAYGSNMDEDDFKEWCQTKNKPFPKWECIGVASLENYEITFNYKSETREAGTANIMEKRGSIVYGLLYIVNKEGLDVIRKKEGHPYRYEEIKVDVKSGMKVYSKVITYKVTKNKELDHHVPPTKSYLQLIIENGKKYSFPEDYLNYLEGFVTVG